VPTVAAALDDGASPNGADAQFKSLYTRTTAENDVSELKI